MTTTTDHGEQTGTTSRNDLRGGGMQVARSRGALSGVMLIVLGAWGALIPFVGPYFDFGLRPDDAWHWTQARGWLEVLPGGVAVLGGLLSLMSANRAVISFGAWLGVAAGAWFVIGRDLADWWNIGSPGRPAGTSAGIHALENLVLFSGLGALILFFGASAVGRLSIRAVRDVRTARRRVARRERRDQAVRDSAYEQGRRDGLAAAREEPGPMPPAPDTGQPTATTAPPTSGPATPTSGPATPTSGSTAPTSGPAAPTSGPAAPTGPQHQAPPPDEPPSRPVTPPSGR